MTKFTSTPAGIEIIKSYEKCVLTAYLDGGGVPTIGWGSTGADVKMGMTWTQNQADQRLFSDLQKIVLQLNTMSLPINENKFNALVDFVYNLGFGTLKDSSLLKCIQNSSQGDILVKDMPPYQVKIYYIQNNIQSVPLLQFEFCQFCVIWENYKTKFYKGLYDRRMDEYQLYIS